MKMNRFLYGAESLAYSYAKIRKIEIKNNNSSYFLCGCQTLSVILTGDHGLRLSQNRVLGKIFGPTRDEVTGEWRRLQKEELYDL